MNTSDNDLMAGFSTYASATELSFDARQGPDQGRSPASPLIVTTVLIGC
jgi:hypothetical protein